MLCLKEVKPNQNYFHSIDYNMSTALDELKLFLLQDWTGDSCENMEEIVDALQLLLGIVEMKTKSVNKMEIFNSENHLEGIRESIFSNLNSCCERKLLLSSESDDDDDSKSSDQKTENYFTADENYDVGINFNCVNEKF